MQLLRHKKILICLNIIGCCLFYIIWHYFKKSNTTIIQLKPLSNTRLILWWTNNFDESYEITRFCGVQVCSFTNRRHLLKESKAILFYGSDMKIDDFPLPRLKNQLWALIHEESPRNIPFIPYKAMLQHFNYTSTFSRYSDLPLTTHYLNDIKDLTNPTYMLPIGEKSRLRKTQKLAPIVFIQSDCDTMSGRDEYIRELMKYINIDSYGICLHNRDLPASLTDDYLNKLYSPELLHFLARYKFIISYENGVCYDYITEKFWRPLMVGSIPIYYGSPTIKDWQPNLKSVIHITDYPNPEKLAEYLKQLDANDTEYIKYLDHKYELIQPITNKKLSEIIKTRENEATDDLNIFSAFECYICSQLNDAKDEDAIKMADVKDYDCPKPLLYPPSIDAEHVGNHLEWESVLAVGRCQAEILNELFVKNENYTKHEFNKLLDKKVEDSQCN